MAAKKENFLLWAFPLAVILMQLAPPVLGLLGGALLVFIALPARPFRSVSLLFGLTALGHAAWVYFSHWLASLPLSINAAAILGRFGLLGYLLLFALWQHIAPTRENFFHLGQPQAEIRFPLLWKGHPTTIRHFLVVFCAGCLAGILLLLFFWPPSPQRLAAGLLFTLANATLEELLWRGLILPRTLDLLREKSALVLTALAFGFYHISLGYPLLLCLVFAVGGFYFSGLTIRSKGLLAPWLMHVTVNLLMVAAGMVS